MCDDPPWRANHPVDFIMENPAPPGKLWFQPFVRTLYDPMHAEPWGKVCAKRLSTFPSESLLFRNAEGVPFPCVRTSTSYCKYGKEYRKNTTFLTSISALALRPVCGGESCCLATRNGGPHPRGVQGCPAAEKNSLPVALVHALLRTFTAKHRAQGRRIFILLDVFSGWGSVAEAASEEHLRANGVLLPDETMLVHTNDLVPTRTDGRADADLDMSKFDLNFLVRLAFLRHATALGRTLGTNLEKFQIGEISLPQLLSIEGIAMLLHCSVPCTTYSKSACTTHRASGQITAKSTLAEKHDGLIDKLTTDLVSLCLLRPPNGP